MKKLVKLTSLHLKMIRSAREADIQKLTDKHVADIDKLVAAKEQDIMAV